MSTAPRIAGFPRPTPLRRLGLLALPLGLGGCLGLPLSQPAWEVEVAFERGVKMGGCAAGDLVPECPGDELAVTSGDGQVHVVRVGPDGSFQSELVAALPGEAIQCAIGDLDPSTPGAELITVGIAEGGEDDPGEGIVHLHRWVPGAGGGAWQTEELLRERALVHAVAIGDLCPLHEGPELLVAGFAEQATVLAWDADGTRRVHATCPLPAAAKGAAPGLGGAVLALEDGSLVRVQRRSGGFESDLLFRGLQPLARVAATEQEALFCGNDGRLRVWAAGETRVLLTSLDRLRGAVLADLFPDRAGLEAATAGYDGAVTVLVRGEASWLGLTRDGREDGARSAQVAAQDTERLHHLAAARLAGRGTGLVACGYAGRLLFLRPASR